MKRFKSNILVRDGRLEYLKERCESVKYEVLKKEYHLKCLKNKLFVGL